MASYGADDRSLRGHASRLSAALQTTDVDHDVKEYPAVGHSFMNRHTGWTTVFDRIGFRYAAGAAADAWGRIFTFFGRHLKAEG